MHALIIEDESLIALALEEILASCGFTSFDLASSPEEAIAAAARACPDLITADVDLKPGSGIDAVNVICSGPQIPVIFITGTPAEAEARMPQLPLVMKPFTAETISAAVKVALAHTHGHNVVPKARQPT